MKFLLFMLGLCFFFVLYIFYLSWDIEKPFFSSIFLEANLYIFLSLFFIFYTWRQDKSIHTTLDNKKHNELSFKNIFSNISIKEIVVIFFEKYIYILAVILFYVSFGLLLHVFFENIEIEWIFLFFNIIVLFLYFTEEKIIVFQDFLRVNTSVISLYYILFHISYLWGLEVYFSYVDIINILLVWLLFYLFLASKRVQNYKPQFYSYILSFLILEILVFFNYIYSDIYLWILVLSSLSSYVFLIFTSEVSRKISLEKKYIRIWGLLLSYVFILFSIKYIFFYDVTVFLFLPFLTASAVLLLYFHRFFQNYLALFFSCFWSLLIWIIVFKLVFWYENKDYIWIFIILFSGLYLLFNSILKSREIYDNYFFHIFSFIVNLVWCVLFVLWANISILSLSILLMGESIYLFYSYYTLSKSKS